MGQNQGKQNRELKEFEKSTQFLIGFLEPGKVGIWDQNLSGQTISGSAACFKITGLPLPENLRMDVRDLLKCIDPGDVQKISKAVKTALINKSFYSTDFRMIRAGAGETRVWVNAMVVLAEDGHVAGFRGTVMPFSESKKSDEILQFVVDAAPDAIITINELGTILSWNLQAQKMFGWTKQEVIGKTLTETIIPDRFKEGHEKGMAAFLKTGEGPVGSAIELSARSKDEKEFPVELKITASTQNKGYLFVGFVRDISRRKKNEVQIESANRFIDSILENIPNMIFVKDARNLRFVRFNKAGEELLGYSRDALIGKNDYDFFPKEQADFFTSMDREVINNNVLFDIPEEPIDTKTGTRWLHTKKITLKDAEGNARYLLGISEDITERKQAVEQILGLNKDLERKTRDLEDANKEQESFSYSVAHDLRTPIRGITGFARILEEQYGDQFDKEGKEYLSYIVSESKRMGQLIDDLLSFARAGKKEIQKSPVDMKAQVKQVVAELLKIQEWKSNAEINIGDLAPARCDPSLIHQVWVNLISNALKFSKMKTQPHIEIGSSEEDGFSVFYVKDNGIGFDMKYYNKLFGVFQRLHTDEEFPGTGIGLAIVHRIIGRLGGQVWAEATENEGASFYFSLPEEEKQVPTKE